MKKQWINGILIVLGVFAAACGIYLLNVAANPAGMMKALPYVCIGVGCGMFGHGAGAYFGQKTYQKNPELKKQIEIEQRDERNITIANMAKAKAYNAALWVISALLLCFVLIGVDTVPVLLLAAAELFLVGYNIYYMVKYQKQL